MGELANSNFHNAEGGMTAADYEAMAKQTAALLQQAKAARDAQTLATGCKKPVFNIGQKKRERPADPDSGIQN